MGDGEVAAGEDRQSRIVLRKSHGPPNLVRRPLSLPQFNTWDGLGSGPDSSLHPARVFHVQVGLHPIDSQTREG
jgi:hypothetical protein